MSVYSTDSLEDINEISLKDRKFFHENTSSHNLEPIKISADLSSDSALIFKSTTPSLIQKRDTGSNETMPSTDKDTGTAGSRNAIIANRGLVDASKRRRPASSGNGKRDVADRLKRNNTDCSKRENSSNKIIATRYSKRFSKVLPTKSSCCTKDVLMPMKPDKKLGNVLAPKVQQARKPRSYLELYRRRFSGPQYNVLSPEGSTLSVCGDSEREELSDDDTHSFGTPRDDQSELSFYRRIIEGFTHPLTTAYQSTKTARRPSVEDTNTIYTNAHTAERNASDDKSKESLGYRPYTIEEYKTLSIPKLDRSLGPDKVEMQAKREWLMRRRSYGNSVSERNRQRILLQAHRLKSKDAIAEKCFLPPLKDQEVDAKVQDDSISPTVFEDEETIKKNGDISNGRYSKENSNTRKLPLTRRSKKSERTSSVCSPLNSFDTAEDSYLESLKQRHVYEEKMLDRIINQKLHA